MFKFIMKAFRFKGYPSRFLLKALQPQRVVSRSWDDWQKEWEVEALWKKKHPVRWFLRRARWYCGGYWLKAIRDFLGYFNKETPWYKCFWNYIYLENSIFGFFYKGYSGIYLFFFKIGKCYAWSKVLWHDYDFDYSSMWRILRYKLERMEPAIGEGNSGNRLIQAAEIQYAIILITRIERFGNYDADCPYKVEAKKTETGLIEISALQEKLFREDITKLWEFIGQHHKGWWD